MGALEPRRLSNVLAGATLLLVAGAAPAQVTTRASVSTAGEQGDGLSFLPGISPCGRYVSFTSAASNLVDGDMNGVRDVFVHDGVSHTTSRVSVSSAQEEADGHCGLSALSDEGRFIAFASTATNLVAGDTNGVNDVFLHDRETGATTRVSVSSSGEQGNGPSHTPSISADGRFIAFESSASNLDSGDGNGLWDIFVHDRVSGETRRVSVSSLGAQSNGDSRQASISADGGFVAFTSSATTLVAAPAPLVTHIYVHELETGMTTRVSVSSDGVPGVDDSLGPSISADGRFVAFSSFAGNLDPADQTASEDVFVHDRQTGQTQLASVSSSGVQANSWSFWPAISADGRHVSFVSDASNLVPDDTNGRRDVFVRDRLRGETTRASVSSRGVEGDGNSGFFSGPAISADGRHVAFQSASTNLVPGDTNGVDDVFVRDRDALQPIASFCSGDGSGTACPCGNAGAAGHGCANGTSSTGSELAALGTASVAADTLVLTATSSTPGQPGLFFQGDEAVNGGAGVLFGDGLRCAGIHVIRLQTLSADGAGSAATTVPLAASGGVGAGDVVRYQWWYRDALLSPCGNGFNLSNGLEVLWAP